MKFFKDLKETLKARETSLLAMEKKLNRANSLSRTLLSALERSIGSSDLLSYDERQAIKQETKDLFKQMEEVEKVLILHNDEHNGENVPGENVPIDQDEYMN
jgi:hypothetical protein